MKIFNLEPAMVIGLVTAVLVLLVAFGVPVTTEQSEAIVGVTSAVLVVLTAATAFGLFLSASVAGWAELHPSTAPLTWPEATPALLGALLVAAGPAIWTPLPPDPTRGSGSSTRTSAAASATAQGDASPGTGPEEEGAR